MWPSVTRYWLGSTIFLEVTINERSPSTNQIWSDQVGSHKGLSWGAHQQLMASPYRYHDPKPSRSEIQAWDSKAIERWWSIYECSIQHENPTSLPSDAAACAGSIQLSSCQLRYRFNQAEQDQCWRERVLEKSTKKTRQKEMRISKSILDWRSSRFQTIWISKLQTQRTE